MPHTPTDKDRLAVETMASHGIVQADIAKVIGVSVSTLRRWYSVELETAQIKANSRVAQSLFDKAMGTGSGSVTACIFWLKVRAKWIEPRPEDHQPGRKELRQQEAMQAGGSNSEWAGDLDTEIRAN
jgi:transcriptional regulator with XRE-family HTH domain